jgi:hypothetical protein
VGGAHHSNTASSLRTPQQQARRARAAPRRIVRQQQLRIGGAGVKKGSMLDDEEEGGDEEGGDEEEGDEAPAAVTPPTPEEIAKALQRIQERQIQEQTFHDTLVDAQTGQPLHVPGVAGSAHNGVSGIGNIIHTHKHTRTLKKCTYAKNALMHVRALVFLSRPQD